MEHKDYTIGQEFLCGGQRWRCTDIGTRVIVAIGIELAQYVSWKAGESVTKTLTREEAEADGWFNAPPYPVPETVFDEEDMQACKPVQTRAKENETAQQYRALILLLSETLHVALIIAVVYGLGWVFAMGMISALDNVTWAINGKVIAADTGLP